MPWPRDNSSKVGGTAAHQVDTVGNQIHVPACLTRNFGRTSLRMKKASFHCDKFVKALAAKMNYDWHYPTMYDFPMFAFYLMPPQKIAVQHVFPTSLLCDFVAAFGVTSQSLVISTYFHHQVHLLRLRKACFRLLITGDVEVLCLVGILDV